MLFLEGNLPTPIKAEEMGREKRDLSLFLIYLFEKE